MESYFSALLSQKLFDVKDQIFLLLNISKTFSFIILFHEFLDILYIIQTIYKNK